MNNKKFTYKVVNKFTKTYNLKIAAKSIVVMLLGFILSTQYSFGQQLASAQNGNFGLAVSGMFNADGYGIQYLPSVYYQKNRGTYFIAPIVQKQKANVSGVQLNYEYTFVAAGEADGAKGLELFGFATGLFQSNALLGKQAVYNEHMKYPESTEDVSKLRIKSIEAYAGFGLRIKLFKNIKWVNSIGGGGYASFNVPANMYYANHNFGLMLKTGISIGFKK